MTANNAVSVKQNADTVRSALERMTPQFKMALPKHLTPERLLRVTMTAVQNTPKLLDCNRTSLFAAVMTCAQLGLEPDGVLGQAYLVPFKGRVQFIPGYKGLLTLARNSGEISSIQAHEVCAADDFSYEYGLDEHLRHKPAQGDRGEIIFFYAYAKFKDGGHVFEVMTRDQVEAVRDGSEGYKAFKAGYIKSTPWESHFVQMGRKTAIRRLANYLPLQVQRANAIEDAYDRGRGASTDDYGEIVIDQETGEISDGGEQAGTSIATEKLDALANAGGDKPKADAKGERRRTKNVEAPRSSDPAGEDPDKAATEAVEIFDVFSADGLSQRAEGLEAAAKALGRYIAAADGDQDALIKVRNRNAAILARRPEIAHDIQLRLDAAIARLKAEREAAATADAGETDDADSLFGDE